MLPSIEDKGKIFTPVVTKQPVQVRIQTTTHSITGNIHVRKDHRLKDELELQESFIAVTDATVFQTDGQKLYDCEFLVVQRTQVVWLAPIESQE